MQVADALHFLIEDLIEDARLRHLRKPDQLALEAAGDAAQALRQALRSPEGSLPRAALEALLTDTRVQMRKALESGGVSGWYWLSREAHTAWIIEVVSVILIKAGEAPILEPRRCAGEALLALFD